MNDIQARGLAVAQGLTLTETYYGDLIERTRRYARRAQPLMGGAMPNSSQTGNYAAALHYLKAVASLGAAEAKRSGAAVVARMKAMPAEDDVFGASHIRQDGRVLHTAYLFEVKRPEESKGNWDYYKTVATVEPGLAFRAMTEGGCPLIRS